MQNMKRLPFLLLIGSLSACGGSDYGMSGVSGAGGTGTSLLTGSAVGTPVIPGVVTPPATLPPAQPGLTAPADSNAFLVTAYQDGLAEIQLSQLARQRATSEDVKRFAERMVEHHTAMNKEIAQLAQRKNVALPTTLAADLQTQLASLTALPAEQFDRAYMQLNVTTHDKSAAAARLQGQQGLDADVRRLARNGLPILKVHLAAAEEVASLIDPAAFLATAYRDGLAEVQLSQQALQKASNAEVRSFAQRMLDEHTQANSRITTLAQQEGVQLPTTLSAEQQATATELAGFSGQDFDEAYMDNNVIMHAKSVRLFRKQAERGLDPEVKAFASDTQSALLEHLTRALDVDRDVSPRFHFHAYQDGEAEIVLSQMALRRGSNADVRAFAQRMIDQHTAANTLLAIQAQQMNHPLPTDLAPEQLLAIAGLADRTGQEFDQAYMDLNVFVHERNVEAATAAAQQTGDPTTSSQAQGMLPMLNEHLAQARALRDRLNDGGQQPSQPQ